MENTAKVDDRHALCNDVHAELRKKLDEAIFELGRRQARIDILETQVDQLERDNEALNEANKDLERRNHKLETLLESTVAFRNAIDEAVDAAGKWAQ